MAAKRFGAVDLTIADTDVVLMTGATGVNTTTNIRFVNRNGSQARVRLAMVDAPSGTAIANLSPEDYLEFDTKMLANEVLENTGIVVPEGFTLVVRADKINVTCVAFGFEEQIV